MPLTDKKRECDIIEEALARLEVALKEAKGVLTIASLSVKGG